MKSDDVKALEVIEAGALTPAAMSPDQLREALAVEQEKRDIWDEWIRKNLREGIDYDYPYPGAKKKNLLKPGAERVCKLLHLRDTYEKDTDTWDMLSQVMKDKGTFAYKCILLYENGGIAGEGRGCASEGEKAGKRMPKGWEANMAIKMGKKRALVDAGLSVGGLSNCFTQDAEDVRDADPKHQEKPAARAPQQAPAQATGLSPNQCTGCGNEVKSQKVIAHSKRQHDRVLCWDCQEHIKSGGAAPVYEAPPDDDMGLGSEPFDDMPFDGDDGIPDPEPPEELVKKKVKLMTDKQRGAINAQFGHDAVHDYAVSLGHESSKQLTCDEAAAMMDRHNYDYDLDGDDGENVAQTAKQSASVDKEKAIVIARIVERGSSMADVDKICATLKINRVEGLSSNDLDVLIELDEALKIVEREG